MRHEVKFDPEKLLIVEYKFLKGEVNNPEDFIPEAVVHDKVESSLDLRFNLSEKLVRADFKVEIQTDSEGGNKHEANGNFHLMFIFLVKNLEELSVLSKDNLIDIDPALGSTLSAITYSTARGILMTRLQGTALQHFILPIINPNILIGNK